jgi:uracil-DNA glycosylase family 4
MAPHAPRVDCDLCPRLAAFRRENQAAYPEFHNAPVESFGPISARLLVVGLAPGLKGANRTARPFTGDYAGDLLYPTLAAFGFAEGRYDARSDDGLLLRDCRITNVVRCVPPGNKPVGAELNACRPFLVAEFGAMTVLKVVLALGTVAHASVLRAYGLKASAHKFGHGADFELPRGRMLVDSYHCSRYNTNTGRLTTEMFHDVFGRVRDALS